MGLEQQHERNEEDPVVWTATTLITKFTSMILHGNHLECSCLDVCCYLHVPAK